MEQIKELIHKIGLLKLGIVILCGVFLMVLSWGGKEQEAVMNSATEAPTQEGGDSSEEYKQAREEGLRRLLQKVDGVGGVDVMITLKASN